MGRKNNSVYIFKHLWTWKKFQFTKNVYACEKLQWGYGQAVFERFYWNNTEENDNIWWWCLSGQEMHQWTLSDERKSSFESSRFITMSIIYSTIVQSLNSKEKWSKTKQKN